MTVAPTHYAVLGSHEVGGDLLDGIDVLLRSSAGDTVVFGLRTQAYVEAHAGGAVETWGAYQPLPISIDLGERRAWDFNRVLWVGPAAWPCVAWSNAEAFSVTAIETAFHPTNPGRVHAGHDERGLPAPEQVGITVPDSLVWQPIRP